MLQLSIFWQKSSFGELRNSFSMQLAVIRTVINLVVLALVSGYLYHPKVWENDETNQRSVQTLTEDIRHEE